MAHEAGENTRELDPYEAVLYPGHPFAQTHPDRLFLIGTLHGLQPHPPRGARVLEIGCGDGINLVTLAARAPDVRGVGIDRAGGPLERGRRYADALGLDLEFLALDLLDAGDAELGEFDYVVSHGVYAWVPAPVRDALLALAGRVLAPGGVAYVSYNALPGGHLRRAMRDLLLFHARDAGDPAERAARAREMVRFGLRWEQRDDAYGRSLVHELRRIDSITNNSLVHDDLGEVWEPVSLADFAAHAAAHGLRYFGDADPDELRFDRFPDGVAAAARELAGGDVVARDQYLDYLIGRPFRQSLLCRADRTPAPEPVADGIARLHLASAHRPDPMPDGTFASPLDAACAVLAERHPQTMRLDELSAATGMPPGDLAESMLTGFRSGLVQLSAQPPRHATELPERPRTWTLARLMAAEGYSIATLGGEVYHPHDPFRHRVVTLLDGRRDREALLDALLASVGRELEVERDGEAVTDAEDLRPAFAERLDAILPELVEAELILKEN